ncbi:MAG: hypothetical protein IJL76_03145 [Bacilli bacterium]|nr:hypothetical protein [Bacilli bacterium]
MDPNMNQNNQMGVEPQMMNPQEQVQAQVLNYNDVNTTVQEEKQSSSLKKVAIFFVFIAVILIGGGVYYKVLGPEEEPAPTAPSTTKAASPTNGTSTCTLADEQGSNNLIRKTIYTMNFDESLLLISYTKDYTATTIPDDVQSDSTFLDEQTNLRVLAKAVTTKPINGYSLTLTEPATTDSPKTLNAKVIIDFAVLNTNDLTKELIENTVTNVDLKKGDSKDAVETALRSYGYICQ